MMKQYCIIIALCTLCYVLQHCRNAEKQIDVITLDEDNNEASNGNPTEDATVTSSKVSRNNSTTINDREDLQRVFTLLAEQSVTIATLQQNLMHQETTNRRLEESLDEVCYCFMFSR
jgi:hypothetical protein